MVVRRRMVGRRFRRPGYAAVDLTHSGRAHHVPGMAPLGFSLGHRRARRRLPLDSGFIRLYHLHRCA